MGNRRQVNIDLLNFEAQQDSAALIDRAERRYHTQIQDVARTVDKHKKEQKFILIAGPSASGKTTTSVLLQRQLVKMGVNSERISLDNFFKAKTETPLLPNGERDFESVDALNLDELHTCFTELVRDKRTSIPLFDFKLGRENGRLPLEITNDVLLIEGIHALNPRIIPPGLSGRFHKIYISVQTEFEEGGEVILSSKDLRLLRRMLRDHEERNSPIPCTMDMWNNVLRGERSYIRPFRSEADDVIDSIHVYEPLVYRDLLLPLLPIHPDCPHARKLSQLRSALQAFGSLSPDAVPEDSLIQEFI
ncbi:phosphoribulokinase/uridine kinase family protein [[Clostridium] methylpentosum DSM 5476]|uniref:Phosphoribulokinase/uridine kinase family protein n=1 Tax=[Clostridium] methylpentosum DSM 5476 TaxID=537013 RepID=C0EBF9_9FIRM|nr:phosphoribulokinase/uridine kinase family protein [[Clostridium] methylpentosum DSM 5476]MDY3989936.1 hypothetical protein [Massilioclostridium sp.]